MRPRGSAALRRAPARRQPARESDGLREPGLRSIESPRRSETQPGLLRRAARVVHAVGEPVPRVSAHRQPEIQDVRRGVALSRVVGQVREDVGACRRARCPCLQPRQHPEQRGDGLRRARRRLVPDDCEERLRLPAADAVLRDWRIRAERAVHGAGWQSRPRARHAVRHVEAVCGSAGPDSSSRGI